MVAHTFNLSTQEAEAGRSLRGFKATLTLHSVLHAARAAERELVLEGGVENASLRPLRYVSLLSVISTRLASKMPG